MERYCGLGRDGQGPRAPAVLYSNLDSYTDNTQVDRASPGGGWGGGGPRNEFNKRGYGQLLWELSD